MKLVNICSPFARDTESNTRFAKAACRYAAEQGCAPVAVHLLYPQLPDDTIPAQRSISIRMGLRVLASSDELWICGEGVSQGMSREIAEAERLGIPIRNVSTQQIQGGYRMKSNDSKERYFLPEETPSPGRKLNL